MSVTHSSKYFLQLILCLGNNAETIITLTPLRAHKAFRSPLGRLGRKRRLRRLHSDHYSIYCFKKWKMEILLDFYHYKTPWNYYVFSS